MKKVDNLLDWQCHQRHLKERCLVTVNVPAVI
jgi:hypothetical protein